MRALLQRVTEARVSVNSATIGEIGPGLMILVCAVSGDTEPQSEKLAARIARLRIFPDADGRMNRSIRDIRGSALIVSQFTLAADTSRGNRPGFSSAAPPAEGERLYDHFCQQIALQGISVATGRFGADMAVSLTNSGPVTIWMES